MRLCCGCSRFSRHVCVSALLAVGTGGMCVARLCCSRFIRHVCGSAVTAVDTGGMCVALLYLQYIQEA